MRRVGVWLKRPSRQVASSLESLLRAVGLRFDELSSRRARIGFEQCLVRCLALIRQRPRVRAALRERYQHILVDEFQDTDPLQYDILFELVTDDESEEDSLLAGKLCVVGDPKQSVYRFRGADMSAYDDAVTRILASCGERLTLSVNFRSRAGILDLVNRCIGRHMLPLARIQPPYEDLQTIRESDSAPNGILLFVDSAGDKNERRRDEARAIAQRIRHRVAEGAEYRDFALLFRSFRDAESYARELRQFEIPVLVEGGKRFLRSPRSRTLLGAPTRHRPALG